VRVALEGDVPAPGGVGGAGFALAWFYTATGFAYKYRTLGDLGIFFAFGPCLVTGTALIQTGALVPEALLVSIPAGLLIVAILHANNMRDMKADSEAKFTTLAGALGPKGAERFYYALVLSSYFFPLLFGSIWPVVFCALSVPLAIKLKERVERGEFSPLVPETARFVAVYGLLLSAGLYFGS
jgi:1,4-dihydroxy-2-naphthoate octaprenyltransferase